MGDPHRDLRNGKEGGYDLLCGGGGRIVVAPHQHIRMDCGVAENTAELNRCRAVDDGVGRAVTHAEHISVLADDGADVGLTEFDQHVGINGAESRGDLRKQAVNTLLQ